MRANKVLLVAGSLLLAFGSLAGGRVEGVLDGYVGARFDPFDEATGKPLPTGSGLLVHMIPESDPGVERTAPAGEWFLPPGESGRFRIWLEGPGLISRRHWVFNWTRLTAGELEPKPVRVPVGPAALVRIAESVELTGTETVRLLQLESGFARRISRENSRSAVQMPPGQVVACLFDETEGRYDAISLPTAMPAGRLSTVAPIRRPPPLADVLVHFVRPLREDPSTEATVRLRNQTGDVITPEALGGDSTNLYAFYYGVRWKSAQLEFASEQFFAPETDLTFANGGVTYARIPLIEKPSLRVTLLLPPGLKGARRLVVEDHGEAAASKDLSTDELEVIFHHLPAQRLLVRLYAGIWEFREEVDLSAGADREVLFQPSAYHVHGRVYVGDEPTEATVEFLASGIDTWAPTTTDSEGRYQIDLFADTDTARVTPAVSDTPSTELLDIDLRSDTEIDFHLGAAMLEVEVTSSDTGLPIQEALVTAGGVVGQRKGYRSSLGTTTDDEGIARLGPLRPSSLVVRISKKGWATHTERLEVGEDSPARLRVALEPETDVRVLRVTLQNGQPAAGVRAAVFQSLAGGLAWQDLGDGEGLVRIPRRACCVATLLHDAGGLTFVPLESQNGDDETAVRMLPGAEPLRVAAVATDGSPVPWARIRVWIDGQIVGNEVFGMLFRTPLAANWEGVWAISGLAPVPIEVVCWRSNGSATLNEQGQAGLLDGQRRRFAYPWPDLIRIPVIE